jgi:hypothetical protein
MLSAEIKKQHMGKHRKNKKQIKQRISYKKKYKEIKDGNKKGYYHNPNG